MLWSMKLLVGKCRTCEFIYFNLLNLLWENHGRENKYVPDNLRNQVLRSLTLNDNF